MLWSLWDSTSVYCYISGKYIYQPFDLSDKNGDEIYFSSSNIDGSMKGLYRVFEVKVKLPDDPSDTILEVKVQVDGHSAKQIVKSQGMSLL